MSPSPTLSPSVLSVLRLRARKGAVEGEARGGAVGGGTAIQAERSRVQFPMVLSEFFIDVILPAALWPWG
jgi:hypothetical protein